MVMVLDESTLVLCKECTPNPPTCSNNLVEVNTSTTVDALDDADLRVMLGIQKELSPELRTVLTKIVLWDGWQDIKVGAKKEYRMSPQQFDRVIVEYWKFLGLCAVSNAGVGMFSRQVDEIWHTHILSTIPYRQFCMEIFGRFVDHVPNLEKSANYPKGLPFPTKRFATELLCCVNSIQDLDTMPV